MRPMDWTKPGRAHFQGICGIGMAGVAYHVKQLGWQVTGCDAHVNALHAWLNDVQIAIDDHHDPRHVDTADLLVVTPAIAPDHPERRAAQAQGIPIFSRGEVLASLVNARWGIAVCGTHGKTTTSCFITRLLQELDKKPNWCIGGYTPALECVAGTDRSDILVVEADESDGTLALYAPKILVLTNTDLDHLEHFADETALFDCFRQAVRQTTHGIAVCRDHARAFEIAQSNPRVPCLTYGFDAAADMRAEAVQLTASTAQFDLYFRTVFQATLTLPVTGRHNILNALAALAAAHLAGLPLDACISHLSTACSELPGRRFETIAQDENLTVIADYAHHPIELAAALSMAKIRNPARLRVLFQPHRYTRTRALGAEFPAALHSADEVILLPVYAASEKPCEGGTSADLYAHFRATYPHQKVALARSLDEAWTHVFLTSQPGDLIVLAGAGDIIQLATRAQRDCATRAAQTAVHDARTQAFSALPGIALEEWPVLANWSTYHVGGRYEWAIECASSEALEAVIRQCGQTACPWRFFGMGANSWISDLCQPGVALRLAKGAERTYAIDTDGGLILGCGWPGPALLEKLTQEGFSGLEFLDGVPGSLGGWLRMNAGAHGAEIGSRVEWIRCLNSDHTSAIVKTPFLGFGYRTCAYLNHALALTCKVRLDRNDPATIRNLREAFRKKRVPLSGLRTAGSVFKNPEGSSAGRILDQVGCKGRTIGGAKVTEFHANIIATEAHAYASDVLALVQVLQMRAQYGAGIELKPEVCGLRVE